MPFLSQVAVRRVGLNRWQLLEDLCYRDDRGPVPGRVFTAHAGYRTDWATIPRLASWLVSKLGPWDEPSVPHDLGCDALKEAWRQRRANRERARAGLPPLPVREPWLDSRGVDQLWHRALHDVGVSRPVSLGLWVAVRWGALFSPWRRSGWLHWRETPVVLALTALALAAAVVAALVIHGAVDVALSLFDPTTGGSR